MATFEYTVIDLENTIRRGSVRGWTRKHVSRQLIELGVSIVTLNKVKNQTSFWKGILRHVSRIDRIVFLRNLMTMMKAGLNLPEALASSREQTVNPTMKRIISDAEKTVLSGQPLSSALQRHINVFSPITVAMIKIGEHGGKLVETLEFLVKQQEGDFRLSRKIRNALVYPAIIFLTMIAIVVMMMIYVIPKIANIYEEFSAELPIYTRILIELSNFFVNWGIYLAIILVLLFFLLKSILKVSPKFKKFVHRLILNLPSIGLVIKKLNLSLISRSLHMLTKAGVSIDEGLILASNAASNVNYQEAIRIGENFVKRGVMLSDIFKGKPKLFLPIFQKMIRTGEETGYLDDMFQHVSKYYDEDIQNWTSNLSTMIEPILLVITGVVVGGVALAVMFPLWNFANVL